MLLALRCRLAAMILAGLTATTEAAPAAAGEDHRASSAEPAARPAHPAPRAVTQAQRPGPPAQSRPRPTSYGPAGGAPRSNGRANAPAPQRRHYAPPGGPEGPGYQAYAPRGPQAPARGGVYSDRLYSYHGGAYAAVRARPYRYVAGYGYRHFGVGERFPAFLLLTPYFIGNYYLYNLSPPPGPAVVWVRFGPDALLVNTYTGEVVDVAPGLFDQDSPSPPDGYASAAPYPPPQSGPDSPPVPPTSPPAVDPASVPYPGPTGYPEPPSPGVPQAG